MPESYLKLNAHLKQIVLKTESQTTKQRIKSTIVQSDQLQRSVLEDSNLPFNSDDEVTTALHTLHDLGEILWFNNTQGGLSTTIFLSPKLVIGVIRQLVNHNLADERYAATIEPKTIRELYETVRLKGYIQHQLVHHLELWKDVEPKDMLKLKLLMFELHLVYPVGDMAMKSNSDLVMPLYWKMTSPANQPQSHVSSTWDFHVQWVYIFQEFLPDDFFEKLGVKSHPTLCSQEVSFTRNSFSTLDPEKYETTISREIVGAVDVSDFDTVRLSIDVRASSEAMAWEQIQMYIVNIEKLLELYPGLWVTRYVTKGGKLVQLELLMADVKSAKLGLLPPDMKWYEDKIWQESSGNQLNHDSTLVEEMNKISKDTRQMAHELIKTREAVQKVEETTLALMRTTASPDDRKLYPALWTWEEQPQRPGTFRLKLRSELTGKCFHEQMPIEFTDSKILGEYGEYIKGGVSILWGVIPDSLFVKPVIEMTIGASFISWLDLDTTMAVHNLIDGVNLTAHDGEKMKSQDRSLSPGETLELLRKLLRARFKSDIGGLIMTEKSGLQCGLLMESIAKPYKIEGGTYVWASREELIALGSKVKIVYDRGMLHACSNSEDNQNTHDGRDFRNTPQCTSMKIKIGQANNLPDVRYIGKQSPFCTWRLVDSNLRAVASGQTKSHDRGDMNPQWGMKFSIPSSVATSLDSGTLFFEVKTTDFIGLFESTIAEGTYQFQEMSNIAESGEWNNVNIALNHSGDPAGTLHFKIMWSST